MSYSGLPPQDSRYVPECVPVTARNLIGCTLSAPGGPSISITNLINTINNIINNFLNQCADYPLQISAVNNCVSLRAGFCGSILQYINNAWGIYRSPGITEITVGLPGDGVAPGAAFNSVATALGNSLNTNCRFIRITDDTTDAAALNIPANTVIYIDPGVTWTVTGALTINGDFVLLSNSPDPSARVILNIASSPCISGTGAIFVHGLHIINQTGSFFADPNLPTRLVHVNFECADAVGGFFTDVTAPYTSLLLDHVKLTGGGTNCTLPLVLSNAASNFQSTALQVEGSFGATVIQASNGNPVFEGIRSNTLTAPTYILCGIISNFQDLSANATISTTSTGKFTQVLVNNCTLSTQDDLLVNAQILNNLTITAASQVSQTHVQGTCQVAVDNVQLNDIVVNILDLQAHPNELQINNAKITTFAGAINVPLDAFFSAGAVIGATAISLNTTTLFSVGDQVTVNGVGTVYTIQTITSINNATITPALTQNVTTANFLRKNVTMCDFWVGTSNQYSNIEVVSAATPFLTANCGSSTISGLVLPNDWDVQIGNSNPNAATKTANVNNVLINGRFIFNTSLTGVLASAGGTFQGTNMQVRTTLTFGMNGPASFDSGILKLSQLRVDSHVSVDANRNSGVFFCDNFLVAGDFNIRNIADNVVTNGRVIGSASWTSIQITNPQVSNFETQGNLQIGSRNGVFENLVVGNLAGTSTITIDGEENIISNLSNWRLSQTTTKIQSVTVSGPRNVLSEFRLTGGSWTISGICNTLANSTLLGSIVGSVDIAAQNFIVTGSWCRIVNVHLGDTNVAALNNLTSFGWGSAVDGTYAINFGNAGGGTFGLEINNVTIVPRRGQVLAAGVGDISPGPSNPAGKSISFNAFGSNYSNIRIWFYPGGFVTLIPANLLIAHDMSTVTVSQFCQQSQFQSIIMGFLNETPSITGVNNLGTLVITGGAGTGNNSFQGCQAWTWTVTQPDCQFLGCKTTAPILAGAGGAFNAPSNALTTQVVGCKGFAAFTNVGTTTQAANI